MTAMSGFFNAFWATLLTLAAYSLAAVALTPFAAAAAIRNAIS